MYWYFLLPLLAFILDYLFGDPEDWPHPVQSIGWLYNRAEQGIRGVGMYLTLLGGGAVCLVTLLTGLSVWFLSTLPIVGWIIALYFGFSGLALGSLVMAGEKGIKLLAGGNIDTARKHIGGLVSRDTSNMDNEELAKALAESLSENFNDGFVAPWVYLCMAGPVGLWVYKSISTADSMWGYRTEQWKKIGKVGARLDDILAWLPARISGLLFVLAGKSCGLSTPSLETIGKEADAMESPNSGWPMAAAANILQAGMGGQAIYFGKVKEKPWLGPKDQAWTDQKLNSLIGLIKRAAVLSLILPVLFIILRSM